MSANHRDYVDVVYNEQDRPLTSYPDKLARYLFDRYGVKAGQSLLDIGCGRGEFLRGFIACGVQDLPETVEASASFGFTADDIGDYLFDVLASYGHDFSSVEFLTGDNAYINGALCTKIEAWIYRNKGIRRSVPLVGCASHKLNLAVQFLCSENPIWSAAILQVKSIL
jgi:hypothetical protein